MRTNIVIDDKLMAAAMEAGGFATKREAVEEGLRILARRKVYQGLLALGGQLTWAGDDDADWTKIAAPKTKPQRGVARNKKPAARRTVAV